MAVFQFIKFLSAIKKQISVIVIDPFLISKCMTEHQILGKPWSNEGLSKVALIVRNFLIFYFILYVLATAYCFCLNIQ